MEKKRVYVVMLASMLVGIACSMMFGFYLKREQSRWAYELADQVLLEIEKNYPEAEENAVAAILSGVRAESGQSVLEKYGVEKTDFENLQWSRTVTISPMVGMTVIFLLFASGIFWMWCVFWKKEQKQMDELGQYCEDILQEKASLQLRDNEEGTFSILKNKVYDITVLLREKNEQLEKNKKETERFLEDISHQLKTPITSLHMTNEILYMDLPEEKRMKFLDNMHVDLQNIEWFVKTMLNLAKLDSHTLHLKRELVEVRALSEQLVDDFQIFCEVSGCEILCGKMDQLKVYCDKKWLLEALRNIVKNAIEHGAKRVTLDWDDNVLYTKLTITDDGDGIAKEELPHIFERFYRTKGSREDSMGLGMAFTKQMIEYQDGEVKVKSRLGEGTTFFVKLYKKNVSESL